MGTAMHLDWQLTSPRAQASRHLTMATWAEVWGDSAEVVVSAVANAARAPVRKMAVKRIFEVGFCGLFGLVLRIKGFGFLLG